MNNLVRTGRDGAQQMPRIALTIYQPWASLIIAGAKPFEFRSYRLPAQYVGERVIIHAAGKKLDVAECRETLSRLRTGGEVAARTCLEPEIAIPVLVQMLDDAARGAVVNGVALGEATFGEAVRGRAIADHFGYPVSNRDVNWGWPMLDIEEWPDPVQARGFQGIWTWGREK